MKRGKILAVIFLSILSISSVVNAGITLTVNGLDSSIQPLELKSDEQILIGPAGEAELEQKKYDLSLVVTGGTLEDLSSLTSKKSESAETVQITAGSLDEVGQYLFSFSDTLEGGGLAVIDLTINTDMVIDGTDAVAGTKIYELIMFGLPELEQIIVFGINYASLSYKPPVQEEAPSQSLQSESLESIDLGGGTMMMMGMGYQQEDPVWFDNPAECPDFDNDNFVNFIDYAVFAGNWLQTGTGLSGDFDEDGSVDVNDLAHFCEYWLVQVDCPEYYADNLPYATSFEEYQGYTATTDPNNPAVLDYQEGWQVNDGFADIQAWWAWSDDLGDYTLYQYVVTDANTVITKEFNDEESNHNYIRFSFIPAIDQKISIKNDSNTVASVWFNSNGYIYVLDNGSYVNTNVFYGNVYNDCWWYYYNSYDYENIFTDLKLKINWSSNNYEVYFDGGTTDIANQADFTQDFDTLTTLHIENTEDWYVLNSFSINGWSSDTLDIDITSPCACDTDLDLKGRVPIIGTASGTNFGKYDIYICPADLDSSDFDNWVKIIEGDNIVNNDVLGYWNTSEYPNGYYYIGVVLFNDLGYPEGLPNNWFQMVIKELYIGGNLVYQGPGYFPVVGELKSNTFYHEEEPEITVPWAGTFPFEFKRIFNNNRKYYTKPLYSGWTHNSQITLVEDTTYHWETRDSGPFLVPAWDDNMLGFGYIWIQYPDGSRRLFRNENPEYAGSTVTYRPWPDDNSGDYIKRTSYEDFLTVTDIYYTLYTRDGMELDFSATGLSIPWGGSYGSYGWKVEEGISSMSDRFGNTLSYSWRHDNGKPVAISSISGAGKQIVFTFDNDDRYTKAELKVGTTVYRTLEFDIIDPNDGTMLYTVTKKGKGVNGQGVYNGTTDKEYATKYEYDSSQNLRKIININNSSQDETLVEVAYDGYGRVETRKDYIESANYLETTYDYIFDDPNVPSSGDNLVTIQSTDSRNSIVVQNEDGAVIWQETVTSDGSAVTDANSLYEDSDNPLKPTDVYEYFDGYERYTWNDYSSYGDLIEQNIYIDDTNYIATELEYHPDYAFEISRTNWQDVNKTGEKVQKLSLYGDYDGSEDQHGDYLVKEKVLLYDGDPNDPNDNLWAITSYEYYNTGYKKGLVKEITGPEGFATVIDYDDNGYKKLVSKGDDPNNVESVERYYHDAIGQLLLKANPLGGVTLNYYDEFGRLYLTRKYEDSGVMSLTDVQFVPSRYEQMTAISESKFGYDEQGFKTFEKLETTGEIDTTYTFNGLDKRKTFDNGSYVEFSYDTRGNKTQEYRYEYTDQIDWYVTYSYDSMDRLTGTNWFDYDDTTLAKSQVSDYYGTGKKKFDEYYGYGGALEKKVSYGYDILARQTNMITDPEGLALTASYDYDAVGNRTSIIDPKGSVLYFDFDNANRETAEYFAAESETEPNNAVLRKEITYYDNNKVLSQASFDYDGTTVLAYNEFVYDARQRLTQVTQQIDDTNDAVTVYDYSDTGFGAGNAYHIRITDAENKDTWIALDNFGRRTKILYPSSDYELYEYYGDGTLYQKAIWDANSTQQWVTYDYDGYGRLTDIDYPDSATIDCTYDGFGRKLLVDDGRNANDNIGGTEQISFTYDVLSRISTVTDQDGYIISYAYRHDDQKEAVTVEEPGTPTTKIYDVQYSYDTANRLEYVRDGLITDPIGGYISKFSYDDNGNRDALNYYLSGSLMGSTVDMSYTYNRDNLLTNFTTTGGPTFSFDADDSGDIDGLGRLVSADETIGATSRTLAYTYDDLSQLKTASVSNINSTTWTGSYTWHDDGNLDTRTEAGTQKNHSYTGDLLTTVGANNLTWDDNGSMTVGIGVSIVRNADNRIQSATAGSDSIDCIYDDEGRMVYKTSTISQSSSTEKYILDIVGDYPVILVVIDTNGWSVDKSYFHADGQTVMQQIDTSKYFYLHDRLGSTRQVINTSASVVNSYTYDPRGNAFSTETSETVSNHYQFANYHWDSTIGMYYLNARWYDPVILRFTGRDPVNGKFNEPLTLHKYLYCLNNPINATDPSGEFLDLLFGQGIGARMRASSAAMGARAMAFAGRIYAAAYVRAAGISMFISQMYYGDGLSKVSRWGRPGLQSGDWVMKGTSGWVNYILSGKWQPGMTNQFAYPSSGQEFWVNSGDLMFPPGMIGFLKALLGQRIYNP